MELQKNKNIVRTFDGIVLVARSKPAFKAGIITDQVILPETGAENISPAVYAQQQPADSYGPALPLESNEPSPAEQFVADGKKRMFLRLAGIAGIGSIAAMLLPKKAQAFVLGGSPTSGVVGVKDSANTRINPAKEDGNLSSINTQAQKLTFDGGSNLYVQAAPNFSSQLENASSVIINPAQEDGNLATIAAQTSKLTFDGSNNLLTAASGGASIVGLKDTTGTQVNPSTDDSLTYLRRIAKLLEPMGTVDIGTRQRISLDIIAAGVALPAVTAITNALPTGANVIGSLTNLSTLAGQNQQMYQDVARNAFASGIRQNLSWS